MPLFLALHCTNYYFQDHVGIHVAHLVSINVDQ